MPPKDASTVEGHASLRALAEAVEAGGQPLVMSEMSKYRLAVNRGRSAHGRRGAKRFFVKVGKLEHKIGATWVQEGDAPLQAKAEALVAQLLDPAERAKILAGEEP